MKIILPLNVIIPRKTKPDKVFALNLNIYRNTHYMTLNQAKAAYKELVHLAATLLDIEPPYTFTYTVFPANNRKFDLGNVLPIIQKFTDDALIECGIIQDDSHRVIRRVVYDFGEVDKENPRCELTISRYT